MLVDLILVKSYFFLSDDHVGRLTDLRFIQFPTAYIKRLHTDFSDSPQGRVLESQAPNSSVQNTPIILRVTFIDVSVPLP